MVEGGAALELRRELARPDSRGGKLAACLAEVTRLRRDDPDGARQLVTKAKVSGSSCSIAIAAPFLDLWSGVGGRTFQIPSELLRALPELIRGCPECWRLRFVHAMKLDADGRRREALASIDQSISTAPDGYPRILFYIYSLSLGVERRRALARTLATAAARDPRPGVRLLLLHEEGKGEAAIQLAHSLGDWFHEWQEARAEGYKKVETGEPAVGLEYLNRAVALVDSVGRAPLQMISYMDRGRAYAKLGQLEPAERDLLHAIALGSAAEEPYYLRESHHNLAHVYESAGRFREAGRAIDQFVRLSRDPGLDAWWLSLHDAGIIRWKAGWHAAARLDFEAMVRAIDQRIRETRGETSGYYYAAEYYERLGDLPRARTYYQAGALAPGNVDPQNLAGLVRVFERLGQEDSAEAVARSHDANPERWPATETPLLPGVLANRGRYAEAVRLARTWAERQATGGHVPATTAARLEVAELLLRSGKPDSALHEATEAERLAKSLTLTDQLIRAGELRGQALIAMGRSDSGIHALRTAASLAGAHPTVESALTTQLFLGDALAATGATDAALVAYDVAARAVERVTGRLDLDLERAGYRDRHPLPFDGALRALLGPRDAPKNLESIFLWSQRRTGAALARATGGLGSERPVTLLEAQRGLGTDDALVHYLVVDSLVAAIVVTRKGAALVPLPITLPRLQALIDRVRRPLVTTYGGRIDLSRARYDESAARDLNASLLGPLESQLAGYRRLAIVPDGPLVYLPFEALLTGRLASGGPEYLIDRFEIVYLPSAEFLRRPTGSSSRRVDRTLRILAVENAVSAGEQEIAAMRAAWPASAITTLVGAQATETSVREAAHSHAILHLAAHGIADGRDPLASHLKLRPDGANDGYLHVNEIAAEGFRGRLVVLSGCETLVGPDYRGEGLMGLARAFLAGGSAAVIASRWPVGPATAELMGGFYRRLARGEDLATALRNAQLDLRRNPRRAHPFHWAGFVLVTG
jgi:CHAT domain-containing protein/tetratricopeptide (TPR) repeat protein